MATETSDHCAANGRHVQIGSARLYCRQIGDGVSVVIVHGGPDFDHTYLLPEMDRLSDSLRLVYYDQRGRGRSAEGVEPEDVGIDSDIEDLDGLRRWLGVDSMVVLGHSWGGVLAMEYALRYPEHLSHLVLMNTAPASNRDMQLFREHLRRLRTPDEAERMAALRANHDFLVGDVEVEAEYYRLHYRAGLPRPELVDTVVGRLRAHFTREGIVKARQIEERLYQQTWSSPDYDLVPALSRLDVPTLVLHGDQDFVPVELAARIAEAMPQGELVVVPGCGHFAYLEFPDMVHAHITSLLRAS